MFRRLPHSFLVVESYEIIGKKASIVELCKEGKLEKRKCRKLQWLR